MTQPESNKQRRAERLHGRVAGRAQNCNSPGCEESGEFRAPAPEGTRPNSNGPGDWQWLCLDHVREFNARYNFFSGMSPDEIEAAQRPYAGWERETRAFSATPNLGPRWSDFSDPLEAVGAHFGKDRMPREDGRPLSEIDRKHLKTMGLERDADRSALRKRYSELVRRYHPDRNGGDRSHEKALQEVIHAYTQLKSRPAFA